MKFGWQNCDAKLEKQCIIRNCARKIGYSANFGKVPSTLPKLRICGDKGKMSIELYLSPLQKDAPLPLSWKPRTRKVRDATIETGSPACGAQLEIIAF